VFKSGVCDSCFQVLVTGFLPQEKGKINLFPVAKILELKLKYIKHPNTIKVPLQNTCTP
jgi:hypothetical protein